MESHRSKVPGSSRKIFIINANHPKSRRRLKADDLKSRGGNPWKSSGWGFRAGLGWDSPTLAWIRAYHGWKARSEAFRRTKRKKERKEENQNGREKVPAVF